MKKLLVTGAGGYIGSIASMQLLKEGYQVIALDNFSSGYTAPLNFLQQKFGESAIRFYKYDLRDSFDELFEKEKNIDAVVHFAGVCSVHESMQNPAKYFSNNVTGSQKLLEAMRKQQINYIVFSSSCTVYKETISEKERKEKDQLGPGNPYGESKLIAEKMIQWYSQLFGIKYNILRYFNVCGAAEDGSIGDSKNPSWHIAHNALLGALGIEPFFATFPKVNTPDGSPIRDYVDILDLVDAHIKSLQYLEKKKTNNIFNLGTGIGHSVLEVVKKVEKVSGSKLLIHKKEIRQGEYAKRVASYKKAKKILNWEPKHSLEDSISTAMLWYQKHPNRWIKK